MSLFIFVLVIHVIICLILVFLVLLQRGKGAELGAAFGGMGQNTVLSPETMIQKITTVVALLFFVTSISLAIMSKSETGDSVLEKVDPASIQQSTDTPPENN